jgi:hypothetical protein
VVVAELDLLDLPPWSVPRVAEHVIDYLIRKVEREFLGTGNERIEHIQA